MEEGLNGTIVARLLGVEQRTFSGWLRAGKLPTAVRPIVLLAALMDVSLAELIGCEEEAAKLRDRAMVREMVAGAACPAALKRFLACQAKLKREADSTAEKRKPDKVRKTARARKKSVKLSARRRK